MEKTVTTTNPNINSIRPAPMWQRILAAFVDGAIVFYSLFYALNHWSTVLPNGNRGWHGLGATAALCLIAAYWIVPEWLFGSTVGKFIFRLRVVSDAHGKANFIQSLKRNLMRPIDFIFFYFIGFVVAMLNPLRQRLGDQWARTIVVTFRMGGSD
jgi:uncharacterized RDD family membrane protein YckC